MKAHYFKAVRPLALFVALSPLAAPLMAARAQTPQSLVGVPLPNPNGFDLLTEAANSYVLGPEGTPASRENLPFEINLRRQRASVNRNAKALKLIREALQLPIQHPPVPTRIEEGEKNKSHSNLRALAALLKQDSAVRAGNVDWPRAIDASLDCIELGVAITRGAPLDTYRLGYAIEHMGRQNLTPIVLQLKAEECRAAAKRLEKIESLRPLLSDPYRAEKTEALAQTREAFEKLDWTEAIQKTLKPNGEHFTAEEITRLEGMGQDEVQNNVTRLFDEILTRADAPYNPAKVRLDGEADPWSRLLAEPFTISTARLDYDTARTQNLLLKLALELRAQRVEAGTQPETFETALDPFGGTNKLIYRRDKDAYLLYSVGPNGKDDGGTPATLSASGTIAPDAIGDLLAPVFSQ